MNLWHTLTQFLLYPLTPTLSTEELDRNRLITSYLDDIPNCSLNCLYPQTLATNCSKGDHACTCSHFQSISLTIDFQYCYASCPTDPDQRWTPRLLLDFCSAVGTPATLPEYMEPYANPHRREDTANKATEIEKLLTIYSVVTTEYASGDGQVATTSNDGAVYTTRGVVTVTEVVSMSMATSGSSATATATGGGGGGGIGSGGSGGLSVGAKAGIGIGVPVGVICVVVVGMLVFRRRRRGRVWWGGDRDGEGGGEKMEEGGQGGDGVQTEAKAPDLEIDPTLPPEIDGATINESGGRPVGRQHSRRQIFELSAGSIRLPRRNVTARAGELDAPRQPQDAGEVGVAVSEGLPDTASELPSEDFRGSQAGSSVRASEQLTLPDLEGELARVARNKERVRYLQLLEEREEQLRQLIASQRGTDEASVGSRGE
ncbi:hypothetical protein BO71DRAFT_412393 [Aspergillus ellipticus CBS 707.79]|uniref:Extracellular membrane protein CFEM domain-containing protein n=1 Tax=Aspergillus ellipticus CBS 707.79 TaxID=1448320 RepID=A0A319D0F1_9EURO|nr:hypothetical protein BO71DRAFT_412393 [Aspergillus ellipticus CBS 707.79]